MDIKAKEANIDQLIIAVENVEEARMVKGIEIVGCDTLRDAVDLLEGKSVTPSTHYPSLYTKKVTTLFQFLSGKRS